MTTIMEKVSTLKLHADEMSPNIKSKIQIGDRVVSGFRKTAENSPDDDFILTSWFIWYAIEHIRRVLIEHD